MKLFVAVFVLAMLTTASATAQVLSTPGPELLIEGRSATFIDRADEERDSAWISVQGDRELKTLVDPRCPETARIQLASVPEEGGLGLVHSPIAELPCEGWRRFFGGYLYLDNDGLAGGVKVILYTRGRLLIHLSGENYVEPPSPMAFAQVRFEIGESHWLSRFYGASPNRPELVRFNRPSKHAQRGERAFWDTLFGDPTRKKDALRSLRQATRVNPRDGRSFFLLGMMRLYEAGNSMPQWHDPDRELKRAMRRADRALSRAEALLWDGQRGDSRVPGFAAFASFQTAFLRGDAAGMDEALERLNRAVEINPIFNNFSLFGAAAMTERDDPVYDRVIELADDLLGGGPSGQCLADQPEICGNGGHAKHGVAGALAMLGDMYLKRGNAGQADQLFAITQVIGGNSDWEYLPLVDERRAQFGFRYYFYANDDPADDPPIIAQSEVACVACHGR